MIQVLLVDIYIIAAPCDSHKHSLTVMGPYFGAGAPLVTVVSDKILFNAGDVVNHHGCPGSAILTSPWGSSCYKPLDSAESGAGPNGFLTAIGITKQERIASWDSTRVV